MTEHRPTSEAELIEQIRAVEVPAPDALHERVAALVAERAGAGHRRERPPLRAALAGATALAVVAIALAVVLGGGGGSTSPLRAATTLALAQPTLAPPAESVSNRSELTAKVDGVAFPYWEESLGWRSVGAREGAVAGRPATTVYYSDGAGRRIGYAILAGAAPQLSGGTVAWRGDTEYRLQRLDGAEVVTWLRDGHLCVVAGRGVAPATLLHLASWQERALSA